MAAICRCCSEDPFEAFGGGGGSGRKWTPKSAYEVTETVDNWEQYINERVAKSMPEAMVRGLLEQIASNIDKYGPDPVLDDEECIWYGNFFQGAPVIQLHKPGETEAQPTFVNRILAFFFATDAKFAALQKLPKVAFPMDCGNSKCIAYRHIADP